jgi:hypothetical protein
MQQVDVDRVLNAGQSDVIYLTREKRAIARELSAIGVDIQMCETCELEGIERRIMSLLKYFQAHRASRESYEERTAL